jgi:hypothetical protein
VRQGHPAAWLAIGLALLIGAALPNAAMAGPYTRLQVLMPGETAAPGTATGKTGSARAQVTGIPFNVTVNACDATWNTVTTIGNAIQMTSTNATATLPPVTQLSNGTMTVSVTFNAAGSFTVQAHDQTDNTIPNGVSASVLCQVLDRFEFAGISQKHKYAGVPDGTTIWARDPNGGTVTAYNGPVSLREITSYGEGRISPETVTLTNGTWSGNLTMYRADETSINRGNVNMEAYLASNPAKKGTSDPFVVHPGAFSKMQVIVPGQTPLPGSVTGYTGSPATQAVGTAFTVSVYATDAYWNPVPSADNVNVSATGSFTASPATAALTTAGDPPGGYRTCSVTLNTVGSQTVTADDLTTASISNGVSPAIQVIPAGTHHFAFNTITGPITAGVPTSVTIRAVDSGGNTVPTYAADAILTSNTGTGSIIPSQVTFAAGTWTGNVIFKGAGGAVALTCADYSAPPKTGTSNTFVVNPGPFNGLQVLLPGESAAGGTATGKTGTPTNQTAGTPFTITVRAVDQYWNLVSGVNDNIHLISTDAFAWMPADTTLSNGQCLIQVRLHKSGNQTITASDNDNSSILTDTSSQVLITGGSFSKLLILAPGESPAPGTLTGRTGTATDQSINYAFTITVLATDAWWNPVTGSISDVVHITSGDPLAQLPADAPMSNGRVDLSMRLSTGGFQQISVSDVSNPSKTGSTTQVRAISSGFHLTASITPSIAQAGVPFTLDVKVTNDAGSVIQEINSFVTLEVQNAGTLGAGRGVLLTTQGQLQQGRWLVSETYTFAEPIIIIARDDAGNAPATSNPITIVPGNPTAIRLTSNPSWVGGNKHATINARVVDDFDNGVPDRFVAFSLLSGTGTLSPLDSLTDASGNQRADFLSPRNPEHDMIHAVSGSLTQDLDLEVAFVDPTAGGGFVTNYPNPFHAGSEGTTLAYKLDDMATVTLRIYTTTGSLVRREVFAKDTPGGRQGLNEWVWDGKNGKGEFVASGGYIAFVEAQGTGETVNVIRRKIAVVR